jgi:UDP-N-acetylmuramate--L-alanine ligase
MYVRGMKQKECLYFLGIAGQTMSGLAVAAKHQGYVVSGVDAGAYPPATDALDAAGIHYYTSYGADHIDQSCTIVLGNAIPEDNLELLEAKKKNIPIVSYPELVERLTKKQERIVVCGTHGKTTTSTLLAWILEVAGGKPDFILGMQGANLGTSVRMDGGKIIVIEGDEYASSALDHRSKFDFYHPNHLIITSLEWDHPDLFPNFASVEQRFEQLIKQLPKDARIIACWDDVGVRTLLQKINMTPIWYGLSDGAAWQAKEVEFLPTETSFYLYRNEERLQHVSIPLAGEHNVRNTLAALALLEPFHVSAKDLAQGLLSFAGAQRRFEFIGEAHGVRVYDDYAHHPTEVAATLQAARSRYPHGRLWAFFVPHTYSRTLALLNEYAEAFRLAEFVLIGELEAAREQDKEQSVSSEDVVAMVKKFHNQVHYVVDPEQAKHMLIDNVEPGDTVVCMSVSGVHSFAGDLVENLRARWE